MGSAGPGSEGDGEWGRKLYRHNSLDEAEHIGLGVTLTKLWITSRETSPEDGQAKSGRVGKILLSGRDSEERSPVSDT